MTITTKIHHATMKKAESLGIKDLLINPVSGNAECHYGDDDGLYEHESPKDLIALIAAVEEGDEDASDELENCRVEAEEDEGEDGDGDEKESHSIVKPKYKAKYRPTKDTCGDTMAAAFSAYVTDTVTLTRVTKTKGTVEYQAMRINPMLLAEVCRANGFDADKWSHLNPGQCRMNAGNVLRGKLRHGAEVVIGSQRFKIEKKEG